MKKTLKITLFLTLVVLALFAITMLGASAATYGSDADAITAGDVVKVEYTKNNAATTEYYASISAAVTGMGDAIADGATITVLDDIAADAATTISAGAVTINGNNNTVTGLALTISGGKLTVNGGSYITADTFLAATGSASVTIYGGYFQNSGADMFTVADNATLSVYGGYFYRTAGNGCGFVQVSNAGVANIYGGTFVADYTDTGYVFAAVDASATLNTASFNGMGSKVVAVNHLGEALIENEASFNFWHNSLKVFNTFSLRLDVEGGVAKSGLRFTSYLTKAYIEMVDSLKDAGTTVTYGTVVVPAKYLEGVNYFSIETVSKALVIPATETGMLDYEEEGGIFIRASICNLPHIASGSSMTYADDYAVIAYAEYTKDGKTVRNYSNYNATIHNTNAASLANDALTDLEDEAIGEYVYEIVTEDGIKYSKYTDAERKLLNTYATADQLKDYISGIEFTYNSATSTYTVTGYTASATEVIIPSVYEGKAVTAIGEYAFKNCSSITSITIPASITSIGDHAFDGCHGIVKVENGVSYVDKWAIGCDSNMTEITLRDKTVGIADYAFYGCSALTEITIPASVTSIGKYACGNCGILSNITYNGTIASWNKINKDFSWDSNTGAYTITCNDGVVPMNNLTFELINGTYTVTGYIGTFAEVVIPATYKGVAVTAIGEYAFKDYSAMTSIVIPASIISIGEGAFEGCTGVIITDGSVSYVDKWVIGCDSSATSVILRDDTVGIADYAFNACEELITIAIPASVTSIGMYAFNECLSLETVTLGEGSQLKFIGEYAFNWCMSLVEITLPATVSEIGSRAFNRCVALNSIVYQGSVAEWQTISKGNDWDYKAGGYTITCTDGTIAKNGAVTMN